ncbi:MAG: FAD-dependent oxidoreductase [Thermodesulfobacteriota bacterium]
MAVEGRTHKPVVDPDLCQRCSVCVRACPAEFLPDLRYDQDTVRGYVYKNIDLGTTDLLPPCVAACPLGQQVREYIRLLSAGKAKEALLVIRQDNPLPGVCGYVCHHPCENACLRGSWDDPVAIRELKRYAVHYEIDNHQEIVEALKERQYSPQGKKVVVVGAGPAGLACAFELVMHGYAVTIMDALDQPGGMLVGAIPPFRLPRQVIAHDVDIIRSLGVTFMPSVRIGKDVTLQEITEDTADASILATGTWKDITLDVAGEDTSGCLNCLDFLHNVNAGHAIHLSGTVLVVGGGNAAIDTARTALRMGSKQVIVLYRRSQHEMPANKEEVDTALHEGVEIQYMVAPKRVLSKEGKIEGIELMRMELGELDETGRKVPIPIIGSEYIQEGDFVIRAIGQRSDIPFLRQESLSGRGTIILSKDGQVKEYDGVFAAGDMLTGPSTVVEAIASGKDAAQNVVRYLEGEE